MAQLDHLYVSMCFGTFAKKLQPFEAKVNVSLLSQGIAIFWGQKC